MCDMRKVMMMKSLTILFFSFLAGCASASSYGKDQPYEAWIIYTGFDAVYSHMRSPFDVDTLKNVHPIEESFGQEKTSEIVAALESAKIGKATAAEKKQMRGPIYLAIYRSESRRRPVYVSNGCHVLNLRTGDLYRLEAETAISILGIPAKNYETRLCKDPGLGITLSPR